MQGEVISINILQFYDYFFKIFIFKKFDGLKMDELKFYLKKNNLNDKGRKKQDLVDRALNYISEKN